MAEKGTNKRDDDSNTSKYIMVSLEDERSKSVAEVLGSKTCKKVIGYLAEIKEASQKDISEALKIPMNTLDYNMKKLLESGFIQKRKNFFWSKKGKKIAMYEISNKSIIIKPSNFRTAGDKIKSLVPAFLITAAGTFAAWVYEKIVYSNPIQTVKTSGETLVYSATAGNAQKIGEVAMNTVAPTAAQNITDITAGSGIYSMIGMPLWAWFMLGALLGIFILSIVNWRKL
jgi:predicted transcriptional regulator